MSRVIIIGGGVAGMSAAHELIERGYQVDIKLKSSKRIQFMQVVKHGVLMFREPT